jgi:hypothetical protein
MNETTRLKKMHVIVPESLFEHLRTNRMLDNIDNLVTQLLHDHINRGGKV